MRRTQRPAPDRDRLILRIAVPARLMLFLIGQIGARTGIVALPFDPHHVFTQIVGARLLLYGLTHWK